MRITRLPTLVGAVTLAIAFNVLEADDPKAEYDRRVAERFASLFQSLDLDRDGTVSKAEAQGDLTFAPAFDDMDINRDGIVTAAELQRFLQQHYGMQVELRRQQALQR
jgi:Ca2+-binding EF-hand superfamily protein